VAWQGSEVKRGEVTKRWSEKKVKWQGGEVLRREVIRGE